MRKPNTKKMQADCDAIAFYKAAQVEAFEAVIENLNPKHFVTGAMYQSTIAAIREMAKEMK